MATLAAVKMGDVLEHAGLGALPLLDRLRRSWSRVLDLIMTGAIPKWAIFAPVFVPLLMRLNVDPEAVLAAYRVGDGPMNADLAAQRLLRADRHLRAEVPERTRASARWWP